MIIVNLDSLPSFAGVCYVTICYMTKYLHVHVPIDNSFPNAKRCLCTKHLKVNVKQYLQNHVGVNTTERSNIMSENFGDDGLVSADDTFKFEAK